MRKVLSVIVICITIFIIVVCFHYDKSIKCREVYSGPFGFSDKVNINLESSPEKNAYIFGSRKEWIKFADTHLNEMHIPDIDFNKKDVIYLQIYWPLPLSGPAYKITNICVSDNKLNIVVKKENSEINVSASEGIYFSYIIICTVDKSSLKAIPNLIIES